jgi:enoyl-CoA hydratase
MPQEQGLHFEAALFGLLAASEDMREGMGAFLEKRPAAFRGC